MQQPLQDFATLIRELREMRGWTQDELGERAGVSGTSICEYEKADYVPNLDKVFRLASAFDVKPSKLLQEIE